MCIGNSPLEETCVELEATIDVGALRKKHEDKLLMHLRMCEK